MLVDAFVKNPVKVAVGVLLVALFGTIALLRMPMQLTPEVQTPTLTVETVWPGASPQEVEREIVVEQEEQLKSVEGLTKLSSESADSRGTIKLEFQVGTDMDESLLKVNSRLQQVREYPEDADQPVISTSNAADRPIAWFILSAKPPGPAELEAFRQKHPELAEDLRAVERAHNVGVALLRLQRLSATKDPAFAELLPPPDLDVAKMRRLAEDLIEARFERVSGVSQSNVIGGLENELQIIVNPAKIAARQLTLMRIRDVLRGQNQDTSAGDFWEGKRRWVVRALGQFRSPEQVSRQLLAIRDGLPVYVSDVAKVQEGFKKPDGVVRRFGENSIAINCLRETGANVLDVMEGLQSTLADVNRTVLWPMGLQLTQVYDETEYIYSAVDLVRDNIFVGGGLTMIVLMLFLHLGVRTLLITPLILLTAVAAAYVSPIYFVICLAILIGSGFWFARGALVVGLAIPTSIIGTFLILGLLGRSLNVISLAGLAFAVGMLVDNAVVVLENIYRRHSLGEPPFVAAVRGTQEVWGAVVASTLTTLAVFLPVVFIQEEAGQLFRDIALAISGAVALSLLVSITVIPTAAARLFGGQSERQAEQRSWQMGGWLAASIQRQGEMFVRATVAVNRWCQRGLFRRLAVIVVLIAASVVLSVRFLPNVEYLPSGNRNLVFGILLPPPGYNLDQLMAMGETIEAGLLPYLDVDPDSPEAQNLPFPVIEDFFFVARGRQVFMGLRALDPSRAAELVPLIQQLGAQLPGTFAVAKQSSLFEQGLTAGRTIDVEITGPELTRLVAMGGQILGMTKQILPTAQARPVPSLDLSTPELHVIPKLVQAADLGLSSADLGFAVNSLVDGAYVGDYFYRGKKIDMTVVGNQRFANATQDIAALPIATPIGTLVPLAAVADVRLESGPEQVNHRERVRAITIEISPPPEVALESAMQRIDAEIIAPLCASGQLEGGYQINLAGTADKLRETWKVAAI